MQPSNSNMSQAMWWISSLATSIVCCCILFIVFAGYIADIKEMNTNTDAKLNIIEARQKEVILAIQNLQRRLQTPAASATSTAPEAAQPGAAVPMGSTTETVVPLSSTLPAINAPQVAPPEIVAPTTVGSSIPMPTPPTK